MSLQAAIKRLALIIEKVSRSHYPTKTEIRDFLMDTGLKVSDRTLDRDFEKLRDEFGIELKYDSGKNGYHILKEDSFQFNTFIKLMELNETADIITSTLKEGKENLKYIRFETSSNMKGINQLKDLYKAIRNNQYISFHHTSYQTELTKKFFNIEPYFLKEYLNRWYLIAKIKGADHTLTFGIDRLSDLKITNEKFIPQDNIKVHELFSEIIGLTYSVSKLEEVLLKVDEEQVKYFESLPWHESQEIFQKDDAFYVRLFVRPNFELIQKILMYGSFVEVKKPDWLRKKIQEYLSEAVSLYK